ncbi:hypothetical protein LCGC14_2404050 [marine sediment metagenome]|uniref:ERF superfamily protein n=1 Tax=marine sediment metagenome TaxID=412755 RepID=A0A0F9ENW0_9ZZZZ
MEEPKQDIPWQPEPSIAGPAATYPAAVVKALIAVMADAKLVPKSGRNEFHKYDYMTDADLSEMVRPLMAKYGLALIPSLAEPPGRTPVQTKNGQAVHTTVLVEYTLVAVDDKGELAAVWPEKILAFGEALDTGDKGFYKASTGANKYAILRLFQLAAGDDPERDSHERTGSGGGVPASQPPVSSHQPAPPSASSPPADPKTIHQEVIDRVKELLTKEQIHGPQEVEEMWAAKKQGWFGECGNQETRDALADTVSGILNRPKELT